LYATPVEFAESEDDKGEIETFKQQIKQAELNTVGRLLCSDAVQH